MGLRHMQFNEGIRRLQLPDAGPAYDDMILYRLPDKATVKIFFGSTILFEAELKVYQYGSIVPFYPKGE